MTFFTNKLFPACKRWLLPVFISIFFALPQSNLSAQCTLNTINADFEYPTSLTFDPTWKYAKVWDNGNPTNATPIYYANQAQLGWKTMPVGITNWSDASNQHLIEFRTGGGAYLNPKSGNQYIELNCDQVSYIYQDFTGLTPGMQFTYSFYHASRGSVGADVMNLQDCSLYASQTDGSNSQFIVKTKSTQFNTWENYTGTYTIPLGQTSVRFRFESNYNDPTKGNFLDNISFTGFAPPPVPTATTINLCENATASQLTATPEDASYTLYWWSDAAATISLTPAPSPTTTTTGIQNYWVTEKQTGGCMSLPAQITVNINASPTATIAGTTTICSGAATNITFTGSNGTAPYTFTYNLNGAAANTTISTNTLSVTAPNLGATDTYNLISVSDASVNSCSSAITGQSAIVTATASITPTFNLIPNICPNSTPPTLPPSSTNTPAITGTWIPATINVATSGPTTYNFTPASGQCATTASLVVTVGTTKTPTLSTLPSQNICQNTTATYTTQTGASQYTWTIPGVINVDYSIVSSNATSNTIDVKWLTGGVKDVSVIAGISGDCFYGSATIKSTVTQLPTIAMPTSTTYCSNETVLLSALTSNPANATYSWTNDNAAIGLGTSGTGDIPSFMATNSTSAQLKGNISITPSLNGCVNTPQSYSITVYPTPIAPTVSVVNNCDGTSDLKASLYSGSLLWSTSESSVTIHVNAAATYTVTQTVLGCKSPQGAATTMPLLQPAIPTATISVAPTCTLPKGTVLVSSPVVGQNGSTINYSMDGIIYQASPVFGGLTPQISYSIWSKDMNNQCISLSAFTITIPAIPLPPASPLVTDNSRCGTGKFLLSASGSDTIKWYSDVTLKNKVAVGTTYTPTLAVTTSFYLTTVNKSDGCVSASAEIIATLLETPPAPTVDSPINYCLNDAASTLSALGTNLNWYSTLGGVASSITPVPNTAVAGTESFYVTQTQNGCLSTASEITVITNELPEVEIAQQNMKIYPGEVAQIKALVNGTDFQYNWTPAYGLSNSTILEPTISSVEYPTLNQKYTLKVTSPTGCASTAEVDVRVLEGILVPNAFSPNNDGINDTWAIENIDQYPNTQVSIFNRFGQFIFESTGYGSNWDGTFNGLPVPIGTYYWIIKLQKEGKTLNGSISVIR